jgi:hypothetical protein
MKVGDQTRQDESVQNPTPVIIAISRSMTLATGTQAYTGIGFRPTWVHFLAVKTTPNSASSTGFDNASDARCLFNDHQTVANRYNLDDNESMFIVRTAGNTYGGRITTMDSDGFTVQWTRTGAPTDNLLFRAMVHK